MAEAQPKVQLPDQMSQLTQLMNVFKGFTSTGQNQTTTADPAALQALAQIAASFTKENATTDATGLIEAAMQAAAKEFAPILGKERAAGMYNVGSTGKMASDAAIAKAGEIARTILQASAQYGTVGANAAGNMAQVTRSAVTRPQTRIDPAAILTQAGGMGLMMLLKRLMGEGGKAKAAGTAGKALALGGVDNLFDTDAGNEVGRNLLSVFSGGGAAAPVADSAIDATSSFSSAFAGLGDYTSSLADAFSGLEAFGGDLLTDAFAPALDIGSSFGDVAFDAASSITDFGFDAFSDFGFDAGFDVADIGGNLLADYGVDAGVDAAADAGLGFSFPYYTAFKAAGDIFDINEIQDVTGAVSKGISTAFEGVSDFFSDPSIICSALYMHGDLPRQLYRQSGLDFARYAKAHDVKGYYAIASRYLELMARSPFAYRLAKHVFTVRAEHAAAKARGANSTLLGWLYYHLLYRINDAVSLALRMKRRIYG